MVPCDQQKVWSDSTNAQVDLNPVWSHLWRTCGLHMKRFYIFLINAITVVGTHLNLITKVVLTSTHNITKKGKLVIYNSFIASNFSYCPLAWHFCSASSTNKLEKLQERALRFINNDYSSTLGELLNLSNTQPLHVRRIKQMACEVYKIVNNLSPKYIQDLVTVKNSPYNFRREKTAEVPRANTTRYGLRSFRSEAPRIWNSLPNNVRLAESYPQFRRLLRDWNGFGCKCPVCSA